MNKSFKYKITAGQEKSNLHDDDSYHSNNNQEEQGHDTAVSCNLKNNQHHCQRIWDINNTMERKKSLIHSQRNEFHI